MATVTEINVNGKPLRIAAEGERSLLSVLRDDLAMTGTKFGCGEGECGACTVLLDGVAARSCRTRISTVGDKKVTTIEGLEKEGKLHPLQQAFIDHGAMQCAYCTSGMIMSAVSFLRTNPQPTDPQISKGMKGNICRCGTYQRIVAAIRDGAKALREGGQ